MEHFSEAEAQRIFAEAARASAAPPPEGGLSLAELQEIGRAAGLDPAAVAAAAATVRDPAPAAPTWRGVPLATRRTRVVPGPMTDDAWAEAVADFRRTFKVQGVTEQIGTRRTWTHVVGETVQMVLVRVTAEPAAGATRLTIESSEQGDRAAANILSALIAACGVALGVALGLKEGVGAGFLLASAFLAVAAAFYLAIRWWAVRRAQTEPVRFDAVLDRVARLVAAHESPAPAAGLSGPVPDAAGRDAPESSPPAGLLGLDDSLPVDGDSVRLTPRRTRA